MIACMIWCKSPLSILLAATFKQIFSVLAKNVSATERYPFRSRKSVDNVIAKRLFPSAKQWNWHVQKNKCVSLSTKVGYQSSFWILYRTPSSRPKSISSSVPPPLYSTVLACDPRLFWRDIYDVFHYWLSFNRANTSRFSSISFSSSCPASPRKRSYSFFSNGRIYSFSW